MFSTGESSYKCGEGAKQIFSFGSEFGHVRFYYGLNPFPYRIVLQY
jgi:hypothetical protein